MLILANAFAYAAASALFCGVLNLWLHGPDPLMVGMLTFAGHVCGGVQQYNEQGGTSAETTNISDPTRTPASPRIAGRLDSRRD